MPLPPSFLDDLRQRLPLSDVIGRRLRLVRAGREYKALCPFHREKTPSFTVNDDKGFFHCFGCGAHGDVVGFVMRHDNLDFMEAVALLAGQAGLQVPKPSAQDRAAARHRQGLHEVVEAACRYFEGELRSPAGRAARDYLNRRGLDDSTLDRFRLGFAPADGRLLLQHLATAAADENALVDAGLARRSDDGRSVYAFFRDRIIFPVADRQGRVVGFGGRLTGGAGPKYLNSPDGPLFRKGELLYGLSRARAAAGDDQPVVVVEGYMDVIALVRAGFEAAVAPLGTALTEAQIAQLWRLTTVPVLCFDGDEAGRRAAWRAIERVMPLLRPDHSVRIALMPAGDDPDSLIAAGGGAAMRQVLAAARPLADIVWEWQFEAHRPTTPEERAGLQTTLDGMVGRIADPAVRAYYRRDVRERLDAAFPFQGRQRAAGRGPAPGRSPSGPRPGGVPRRSAEGQAACILLAATINHPALFDEVAEMLADLAMPDVELERLKQAAIDRLSRERDLDSTALQRQIAGLVAAGTLDRLLNERIYTRAPFARPDTPLDGVRKGWRAIWHRTRQLALRDEVRAAGAALRRTPSAANLARLLALQQQAESEGESDKDPTAL